MSNNYVSWKQWEATEFGVYSRDISLYYRLELRLSGLEKLDGLLVGELGFGNGAFAGWVRDQRSHWVGQEVIQTLSERAQAKGFETVSSGSTFSATVGCSKLDALVAFDVLEHLRLEQLKDFLDDACKALRPGGILIARLPSGDSPFVGAIYFGDLTHRTLLGSSAIRQLSDGTGFKVVQIRVPAFPIAGFSLRKRILRTVVFGVQAAVAWFVRKIIMGNNRAVISPNMLVVLEKSTTQLR